MPKLGPIKQKDLIKYLRKLGWDGPYSGGKHPIMQKGAITNIIPNPHRGDIGKHFLIRILRQFEVDLDEWEAL